MIQLTSEEAVAAALQLAAAGLRVFRTWGLIEREGRIICACPKALDDSSRKHRAGKHPMTVGWRQEATTDPAQLRAWFGVSTPPNLSILTGAAGGVMVLDVDGEEGERSLGELVARHGAIPSTPRAITGSGGLHFLFRHPGVEVPGRSALAPGLDVRGENGQIVVAPSRHESGGVYRWLEGLEPWTVPLAEAPTWLLKFMVEGGEAPNKPPLRVVGPVQEDSEYQAAVARYNRERATEFPRRRTTCPACKWSDCWGELKGTSGRWSCFNTHHGINTNNRCGRAGLVAWHGDQLDLDAYAAGRTPLEQLQFEGYLPKRERAARAEPPPPTDADAPPGLAATGTHGGEAEPVAEVIPLPGRQMWPFTDMGNAERMEARHGADLRYCHAQEAWYLWDGSRWCRDTTDRVYEFAKDTVRRITQEELTAALKGEPPPGMSKEELQKAYERFARASESIDKWTAMVRGAARSQKLIIRPEDMDRDPLLLAVKNGTIELRTGQLRSHRRQDLITKMVSVNYNPAAQCPTWLRFLEQIFLADQELIAFVQRAFGYSLTGLVNQQVFFFCYGTGANGKGILFTILRALLAESADVAQFEVFCQSKNRDSTAPNPGLAELRGLRVVTAAETDEHLQLSEASLKRVTGEEPIKARNLHENNIKFLVLFKLWMAANHLPRVKELSHGFWRRMRCIPFNYQVPDALKDDDLASKLMAELDGILAWAMRGLAEFFRVGLGSCKAVDDATKDYRQTMDQVGRYLEERCEVGPDRFVASGTNWEAYLRWCESTGEVPMKNATQLGRKLTAKGFKCGKGEGSKFRQWSGFDLKQP